MNSKNFRGVSGAKVIFKENDFGAFKLLMDRFFSVLFDSPPLLKLRRAGKKALRLLTEVLYRDEG